MLSSKFVIKQLVSTQIFEPKSWPSKKASICGKKIGLDYKNDLMAGIFPPCSGKSCTMGRMRVPTSGVGKMVKEGIAFKGNFFFESALPFPIVAGVATACFSVRSCTDLVNIYFVLNTFAVSMRVCTQGISCAFGTPFSSKLYRQSSNS